MHTLTWDDFVGAAGSIYAVDAGPRQFELKLEVAEEIRSAGRPGGSFRLEFLGPCEPVLPQAIYPFRRGEEEPAEIFIVPIKQDREGTRYEAIFC